MAHRRRRHVFRPRSLVVAALMVLLLCLLAAAAILFALQLRRKVRGTGLPQGDIIYNDTDEVSCDETLVSHTYQLVGRPDYIVKTDAGPVPVELKSRSCGERGPYEGEKAQLFAYCLLVEEAWGTSVKSGIIKFRDRKWNVPFGDQERRWVIETLDRMRQTEEQHDVARNHQQAARCRRCGYRAPEVCGQALV